MKRLVFFLVIFFIFFISFSTALAQQGAGLSSRTEGSVDNQKYWDTLSFRFMGTLNSEVSSANRRTLFAFYDPNLDLYNEVPTGFAFGTGIYYRPSKYYDLFMDTSFHRTQFLIGKKGDKLRGIWVLLESGSTESPPLPNDIYYTAKTGFLRAGGRLIYPVNKSIEPWFGLAYGLAAWEVAFSNQDASQAYSDIVSGQNPGFSTLAGIDFNIFSQGEKFMKIGVFFDAGGVLASPLKFNSLIWKGWAYESIDSPVILPLRIGISISM